MPYPLYVIKSGSTPARLFHSHWALFVHLHGNFAQGTAVGTSVHVTGSLDAGFQFEVKRNWNPALSSIERRRFLVGEVTDISVAPSPPITDFMINTEARTPLERALLSVPPPAKSLNSAGGNPAGELKDCQWWIRQSLPYAVTDGYVQLHPGADEILDISKQ